MRSLVISKTWLLIILFSVPVMGCSSTIPVSAESVSSYSENDTGRQIVQTGSIDLEADFPADVSREVQLIVEKSGGFVERVTVDESNANLQCRVPAQKMKSVMDEIVLLGEEKHRRVGRSDVTEVHSDLEIRLKNKQALLTSLQNLLERAENVSEILEIEKELHRLRAEIESLQGSYDILVSQIAMSALSVRVQESVTLGPVSQVLNGAWWVVSKLFVW